MNTMETKAPPIDTVSASTYNQNDVDRIVSNAVGQAIAQYEARRAHLENEIDSGLSNNREERQTVPSKYRERIKTGMSIDGKPIYEWVCANTKEELYSKIAKMLSAGEPPQQECNQVLWQTMADEWFDTFHVSKVRKNTLSKDKSLFKNHVRQAFMDIPVYRITATEIQAYLQSKSGYCKSQVRDIMSMLKQVFSLAVDKGVIPKNPMHSSLVYNPSKKPDKPRDALPRSHQLDIIAHLDDLRNVYDKNGDNMNALRFMAFLMYTGLRPCEIYGLRWEDIDVEKMTLSIERDLVFLSGQGILGAPKTEESRREIPFDPKLLEWISPIQSSGFVIHMTQKGREHEHFTEQAANNMWQRIKRSIDVHGMTPYMACHTYATNMNKAGVPIKTAMSMLGHKDERMLLRRYTHTDTEDLTKASESVADYISKMQANSAVSDTRL